MHSCLSQLLLLLVCAGWLSEVQVQSVESSVKGTLIELKAHSLYACIMRAHTSCCPQLHRDVLIDPQNRLRDTLLVRTAAFLLQCKHSCGVCELKQESHYECHIIIYNLKLYYT